MIAQTFKEAAIFRMKESLERIIYCLDLLDDHAIWKKPNDTLSSMGNLVLHLCGNITQYILATLDKQPDLRDRDAEFAADGGLSKVELKTKITKVIHQSIAVIKTMPDDCLSKTYFVQVYELTGTAVILHVVEHLSYHTGQISFYTKLLNNTDLGYYAGQNLNHKPS